MPVANKNIEKLFFIYLIVTPVLDIFGGAYIHVGSIIVGNTLSGLITPNLIVRMVILLLFLFYILSLRDKKSLLTIFPIGIAWLATVAGEFFFAPSFSLFTEMQYMARFGYNILALLVYWRLFQRCSYNREQLLNWLNGYISFTLLILSLAIHIPNILGLGYSNYGRLGTIGVYGFFHSGKDITAVLMMLIPIAIVNYVRLPAPVSGRRLKFTDLLPRSEESRRHLFYLAAPATALSALFSIATKTAFIVFTIMVLLFVIYFLYESNNTGDKSRWQAYRRVLLVLAALILLVLIKDSTYIIKRGFMHIDSILLPPDMVFTARMAKPLEAFAIWKAGGPFIWAFGIGRDTQLQTIEMDVFEVLFYYGIVGVLAMLWLYVKLGIGIVKHFIPRRREDYALAAFISVGLTAAYAAMAGHVLFSVTSGFYFAFMLLYSYLYYTESMEELKLI